MHSQVDLSLLWHATVHSTNGAFTYSSPLLQLFVSTTQTQNVTLQSLCFTADIMLYSAHCECNILQYYQIFFKCVWNSTTILHLLHHSIGSCNPYRFSHCWCSQCCIRSIKFTCRQVLKFVNTAHSEPSRNSFLQNPIVSGQVFWHYTLLFTYILPYCCNSE